MADAYQADHAAEAEDELLVQFRQPNAIGLVRGLAAPVQTVENHVRDLRTGRLLDDAEGAQLDQLGRIVGCQRGDLEDGDYRRFIGAQILANICEGNPDALIRIYEIVTGDQTDDEPVVYRQLLGPAFQLTAIRDEPLADSVRDRVVALMRSVKPGGVGMDLIEGGSGSSTFRFDSGPGLGTGKLARLLRST